MNNGGVPRPRRKSNQLVKVGGGGGGGGSISAGIGSGGGSSATEEVPLQPRELLPVAPLKIPAVQVRRRSPLPRCLRPDHSRQLASALVATSELKRFRPSSW